MRRSSRRFADRSDAGKQLAAALEKYAHRADTLVLALPRGGVPVGFEVAQALRCPLDVLVVRKLGVPGQEELAMGAIAGGGVYALNQQVIDQFRITPAEIELVRQTENRELRRRERAYRGDRPPVDVQGRVVLLVDDGIATGATMLVAVRLLRSLGAERVVVAVPVGSTDACRHLEREVHELVCLIQPRDLVSISGWYDSFGQTTDDEVRQLLHATQGAG